MKHQAGIKAPYKIQGRGGYLTLCCLNISTCTRSKHGQCCHQLVLEPVSRLSLVFGSASTFMSSLVSSFRRYRMYRTGGKGPMLRPPTAPNVHQALKTAASPLILNCKQYELHGYMYINHIRRNSTHRRTRKEQDSRQEVLRSSFRFEVSIRSFCFILLELFFPPSCPESDVPTAWKFGGQKTKLPRQDRC